MNTLTLIFLAILIIGYIVGGLMFCTNWFEDIKEEGGCIIPLLLMLLYSPIFLILLASVYLSEAIKTLKHEKEEK